MHTIQNNRALATILQSELRSFGLTRFALTHPESACCELQLCLVLPDSGFPAFWFHQTFRLDWLHVRIPTSSLPKAEGLPKTPHIITLVFWPLHLDFSLPRSLKSMQHPQKHIVFGALIPINLYTTTYTSRNSDISLFGCFWHFCVAHTMSFLCHLHLRSFYSHCLNLSQCEVMDFPRVCVTYPVDNEFINHRLYKGHPVCFCLNKCQTAQSD